MYGNQGGYGQRRSYAPVQVGEELDLTIEAVGEKGDGIAKKDGFVLFVPNTKQGDNVKVRVTRVLRKVGFAEVVGDSKSSASEVASTSEPEIQNSENFGEEMGQEDDSDTDELDESESNDNASSDEEEWKQ